MNGMQKKTTDTFHTRTSNANKNQAIRHETLKTIGMYISVKRKFYQWFYDINIFVKIYFIHKQETILLNSFTQTKIKRVNFDPANTPIHTHSR